MSDPLANLRRILLAILALGLAGSAAELVLLEHYEEASQTIPLALAGAGLVSTAWLAFRPNPLSVRVARATMALVALAGALGIALHLRGSMEFQRETDPELRGFALIRRAVGAKAPPALAPGLLTELGLLGLACTYRHPGARPRGAASRQEVRS